MIAAPTLLKDTDQLAGFFAAATDGTGSSSASTIGAAPVSKAACACMWAAIAPDATLRALGDRFRETGSPRNLTTIHPIAAGDMTNTADMRATR